MVFKWVNVGCGLYLLVIAFFFYRWIDSVHERVPHPNWGPLPDPWIFLTSPYALGVVGLGAVAVGVGGLLQGRSAAR